MKGKEAAKSAARRADAATLRLAEVERKLKDAESALRAAAALSRETDAVRTRNIELETMIVEATSPDLLRLNKLVAELTEAKNDAEERRQLLAEVTVSLVRRNVSVSFTATEYAKLLHGFRLTAIEKLFNLFDRECASNMKYSLSRDKPSRHNADGFDEVRHALRDPKRIRALAFPDRENV